LDMRLGGPHSQALNVGEGGEKIPAPAGNKPQLLQYYKNGTVPAH